MRTDAELQAGAAAMVAGNLAGATRHLQRCLALDPEQARVHALLAVVLLRSHRKVAAEHEARAALALDPDEPLALYALAEVHRAAHRLPEARVVLERLLSLEPEDPDNAVALANLEWQADNRRAAIGVLETARAAHPEAVRVSASLSRCLRLQGQRDDAEAEARRGLAQHPQSGDLLIEMGHLLLDQGQTEEARQHAVAVLQVDPSHTGALHLIAAVKARQSWLLGPWWRAMIWLQAQGSGRAIVVLLVAYVLFRVALQATADLGLVGAQSVVSVVWLVAVAWTWLGPAVFSRMVAREVDPVSLRRDF